MNHLSTVDKNHHVTFREAVIKGLAPGNGLYVPGSLPMLPESFFRKIDTLSDVEIAWQVLYPFVEGSLTKDQLFEIAEGTLTFPFPVRHIHDGIYTLELFHGPTKAFKDVGARFLARCFSVFSGERKVTILTATSGDTGSAVANGFYGLDNVDVRILFPKGMVSEYQEHQMTSLGQNICALEIEGTFDDCQRLVKQAFLDEALNRKMDLSSANSINLARMLPQMLYYFFAWKQLKKTARKLVVSVPSGNFGNLVAGVIAKKMGLPVQRFVAANNRNDAVTTYLDCGVYRPKPTIATPSNAMDVGAPSNFDRLQFLYNQNRDAMKADIHGYSVSDEQTLKEIADTFATHDYLLDPHGAVGKIALENDLQEGETGLFLETAHPVKFDKVVRKAILDYETEPVDLGGCSKMSLKNNYNDLVDVLLQAVP